MEFLAIIGLCVILIGVTSLNGVSGNIGHNDSPTTPRPTKHIQPWNGRIMDNEGKE